MGELRKRRDVRGSVQSGDAEVTLQEAMAALDLLERYFNQPPAPCGRAVDAVLRLRQMACSANAMATDERQGDRSQPSL
jgi:hypothetical protein